MIRVIPAALLASILPYATAQDWSLASPGLSPAPRASGAAAASPGGVVMFGGWDPPGVMVYRETWVWNGTTFDPGANLLGLTTSSAGRGIVN